MSHSEYLVVQNQNILSEHIYLVYEQAVRESQKYRGAYVTTRKFWERHHGHVKLPYKPTKRGKRITLDIELAITKEYLKGLTQKRLSIKYRLPQSTISNIIKRNKDQL